MEKTISNEDLQDAKYNDLAFYHVALQPKHPNDTFVRECVTLRPPATSKLLDEHEASFFPTNWGNCYDRMNTYFSKFI